MSPEVQAAIIKAASDWATFLSHSPADKPLLAKEPKEQLIENFQESYRAIHNFFEPI